MPPSNALPRDAPDPPDEAEETLLARCRSGDQRAIRTLYDQYARPVMQWARRLGVAPDEVEDVTQEVFSTAFREIHRVQPGALSAWLFRLVSNRVHDRHRRRRVRETFARLFGPTEEAVATDDPERALHQQDAETRVRGVLARMSQKKRDVFVLFELEGLPGDEIALKLGVPVATVWTRLHHARRDFARFARAADVLEDARSQGGTT